jgi:universal stress protein E
MSTSQDRHFDSTLLVVGVADRGETALMARATELAAAARVSVYVYYPVPKTASVARGQRELEKTVESLRAHGIDVDGRVEVRASAADAVLELTAELGPSCVMLQPGPHGKLEQALLAHDDFELIRRSHSPVWLVRQHPDRRSVVLAAIDAMDESEERRALNEKILEVTCELARILDEEPHAIHSASAPMRMPGVIETVAPELADERYRRAEAQSVEQMQKLIASSGIERAHVHVSPGDLTENLDTLLGPMAVDLLVVGAVSTKRLERMLLGGTAEKLLQKTRQTDLLVVKPPSTERRAAG